MWEMTARPCTDQVSTLGEGTRWDAARGELLWVDILGCRLHRATFADDGTPRQLPDIVVPDPMGAVAPLPDPRAGWLAIAGAGYAHITPDGGYRRLAQPEAYANGDTRMNDGACDPQGRFWAGSMAYDETPGAGRLYCLDLDGEVRTVLEKATIPNGVGWSPDGRVFYFTDSTAGTVTAYTVDESTGAISDPRVFVSVDPADGVPDGLTVDEAGGVWLAICDGGQVRHYGSDGTLLGVVRLPVSRTTCPCIGGPDGRTLFISSARDGLTDAQLAAQPLAGRLFSTRVDVGAPPARPYRGPVAA